jgi:hypothetical protein
VVAAAVRAHLAALGSDAYRITAQAPDGTRASWTLEADAVLLRIGPLLALNRAGHTLTVQPAAEGGLVLLAPLSGEGLRQLRRDGYPPAALVEIGGGRHEAWVRVADRPLNQGVVQVARAELAAHYGAGTQGPAQSPAGHLAGFLVHDAGRTEPGQEAAVATLRETRGRVAPDGPALLARAALRVAAAALTEEECPAESGATRVGSAHHGVDRSAVDHSRGDR